MFSILASQPSGEGNEFVALLPFIARQRQNMTAMIVARNDEGAYGELVLLEMPADELVVVFGASVASAETRVDVETGAYHPSWRADDPEGGNDVGAVRLALPAPVDPIQLGPAPATGGVR